MDRKASDKALRKSLTGSYNKLNGTLDFSSSVLDDSNDNNTSMQGVQERLKHIRAGSPFRYKSNPLAVSSPDISKLQYSSQGELDSLEQKVRLAELKARLAEERANRNQTMLSQKMQEVNQLQNTLNSQHKEMLGLERSYDDFRGSHYSPNRYSLNSTFPH